MSASIGRRFATLERWVQREGAAVAEQLQAAWDDALFAALVERLAERRGADR